MESFPKDRKECTCEIPDPKSSALSDRIYTCNKCHLPMSFKRSMSYAQGSLLIAKIRLLMLKGIGENDTP